AHHWRPGDEQLRDVAHHHREMPQHRLRRTDADNAAEQHVHHRHFRELPRIHLAAEVRCEERATTAGYARAAGLDRAAAFLNARFAFLRLRRHHARDAAAAG